MQEISVDTVRPGDPLRSRDEDPMTERLTQRFGLERFHPWQREAIDTLLGGQPVLVVAPTGGGKSLCYQFPATELPGTTVVVSPLIALMEDQVRGLQQRGIAATWISSTLDAGERSRRMWGVREGRYRIVYLAPERLAIDGVQEMLARLKPPLLAIDEAHCIAQWGHDFRPDYLRLRGVLQRMAPRHVLACTATATPTVREEIVRQLGLDDAGTAVILRGFARPNLHLAVREIDGAAPRRAAALAALRRSLGDPHRPTGAAVIYAGTRKETETTARHVAGQGWRVAPYHAGIDGDTRARVNRRFADGDLDVVVATNAFGMGIDRPDIRAVIHVAAPGSVEAYYQEVGRAGRDGDPAHGLLIASSSDFGLRKRLIASPRADGQPRHPEHVERQWALFLDLMRYVEAGSCRHDTILRYFGDEQEALDGCGHCDVGERLAAGKQIPTDADHPTDEDALTVRKALAGVARADRRVGLQAVGELLAGSDTQRIRKTGLRWAREFGLLTDHPPAWILALLRRCLTAGLVDITADQYPMVVLTRAGRAVLRGESPVRLLLPPPNTGATRSPRRRGTSAPPPAPPTDLDAATAALFQLLRAERSRRASETHVPPYIICRDRTLLEIAVHRPTDDEELLAIHGMGPSRLATHGEWMLAAVRKLTS